jgi:hypothetical protein
MAIREHAPCMRADNTIPIPNVHEAPLHRSARGSGQCEERIGVSRNGRRREWRTPRNARAQRTRMLMRARR